MATENQTPNNHTNRILGSGRRSERGSAHFAFVMIEKFKSIFAGLDRAHGVTIVEDTNGNGTKIKGKSFVKRQPVTDSLMAKTFRR